MPRKVDKSLFFLSCVTLLIILRLLLAGTVPLLDKTEARYAEIARLMVETNQWWMLQVDYGVPFWAKPPLSTWLSASSFKIFGITEFVARLPSFLLSLFIVIIVCYKEKQRGRSVLLPAFILLTLPEFFIHTAVVSTDTALAFCITTAMLSFWEVLQEKTAAFWKYLFFIALGLGLLAKGPIMFVLTLPPILVWSFIHRINPYRVLQKLHWKTGTTITLLLGIPWYIIAEFKSPGFLDYFIIGEHFKRFFNAGWKGDLYGVPHNQPMGMIWLFLLLFAFPWVQLVLYKLWKDRKRILINDKVSFLTIWLLWIPFFFTFSSSIVHTYILPVMVPIALLVIHYWRNLKRKKTWLLLGGIFPAFVIFASVLFFSGEGSHKYLNSDKYLLSHLLATASKQHLPIVYWKRKSFSGQFYKKSKMTLIKDDQALDSILKYHNKLYIIVPNKMQKQFPPKYIENLELISGNIKTSLFLLNIESPLTKYPPTASNK